MREHVKALRWINLTTAGYDGITFRGVPKAVSVTNAGHSHASMVAEHVVMLLAALTRRLHLFAEPQSRHVFDRAIALPLATFEGSTVAILGYGGIGRETARRVKAFGAMVIAIARSARDDEFADAVVLSSELHTVLSRADALIVTAALTEETEGMINAKALAAMKPAGILVNIARGGIVDTPAMVTALNSGHLAAAGLDVTDPEPPPRDHPLWDCPNSSSRRIFQAWDVPPFDNEAERSSWIMWTALSPVATCATAWPKATRPAFADPTSCTAQNPIQPHHRRTRWTLHC